MERGKLGCGGFVQIYCFLHKYGNFDDQNIGNYSNLVHILVKYPVVALLLCDSNL